MGEIIARNMFELIVTFNIFFFLLLHLVCCLCHWELLVYSVHIAFPSSVRYPKLNRYSVVFHCSTAGSLLVTKAVTEFKTAHSQMLLYL